MRAEEYKVYSVIGYDGTNVHRGFCPECGSPVISYVTEQPGLRFIKAGSLDDSSWLEIKSSYWKISACQWDPINSSIPSFHSGRGGVALSSLHSSRHSQNKQLHTYTK